MTLLKLRTDTDVREGPADRWLYAPPIARLIANG